MAYNNDLTEKKSFLYFLNSKKYYSLIVGLGVACIHFAIVFAMNQSTTMKITDPLALLNVILITPSAILQFIFLSLKIDLFSSSPLPFPPSFLLLSSSFYGITGGFLASKKAFLQSIAIASIVLLVLLGCLIAGLLEGFSTW